MREAIKKFGNKVNKERENKDWEEGVRKMHEALKRENIRDAVLEIYSTRRVNGMAEAMGIVP